MKTSTKKNKTVTEIDFEGAMMVHNPITKKQEKELAEWVADRKVKSKEVILKIKLQKTFS